MGKHNRGGKKHKTKQIGKLAVPDWGAPAAGTASQPARETKRAVAGSPAAAAKRSASPAAPAQASIGSKTRGGKKWNKAKKKKIKHEIKVEHGAAPSSSKVALDRLTAAVAESSPIHEPAAAPISRSSGQQSQRLAKLDDAFEVGAITEQQYAEARQRLLLHGGAATTAAAPRAAAAAAAAKPEADPNSLTKEPPQVLEKFLPKHLRKRKKAEVNAGADAVPTKQVRCCLPAAAAAAAACCCRFTCCCATCRCSSSFFIRRPTAERGEARAPPRPEGGQTGEAERSLGREGWFHCRCHPDGRLCSPVRGVFSSRVAHLLP